jgi:hypothetical protein
LAFSRRQREWKRRRFDLKARDGFFWMWAWGNGLILFFAGQRFFIEGIATTGLKG